MSQLAALRVDTSVSKNFNIAPLLKGLLFVICNVDLTIVFLAVVYLLNVVIRVP